MAAARASGTLVGTIDALIAATAVHHGLELATRHVRDGEHLAVELVDALDVRPTLGAP